MKGGEEHERKGGVKKELTIKIAGEAGQGMQTVGMALCKLFKKTGLEIFANQDYMSRIRGGNNFFQLRVSHKPLYALRSLSDIVIALDNPSVLLHRKQMSRGGILILDKKKFSFQQEDRCYFDVPFFDMAVQSGGSELFVNSVALGVVARLCGIGFNYVDTVIRESFSNKANEVIQKNIAAATKGYDFTRDNFKKETFVLAQGVEKDNLLMNGNDALALGAIKAGCKFYSAYPMTPSTSILNNMAHYARNFNIVVEQAEDEIAAINMVIGASFCGARSMCATSGGGFALMVEGLSLAGMTETPIVVVDAQRPAPATGFPTRTEQADLDYLIHAGHGEFARVVFAPGSIEEAFYLAQKAFNLAEEFQIPALIMTDQHLADSYRTVARFNADKIKARRFIISREESPKIRDYKRYAFSASGISPRALPGWINEVVYADSDEHTEEGHITEDAAIRKRMVEKRFSQKMSALLKRVEKPFSYKLTAAKTVLVGFGSTLGVMKETCDFSKKEKLGFIHLPQVWPFPSAEVIRLLRGKRKVISVENNAAGQLARLIRREAGLRLQGSILKYDGRPFDLDYLLKRLEV